MQEITIKGTPTMKQLINRLVKWLKTAGISDSQILDCINYITDTGRAQNGEKKKPAETLNK